MFNQRKQEMFRAIHPIGNATSVTVHEVDIVWKNGRATENPADVLEYAIRFTIYWKGPIVEDGYTKLSMVYDNEVQRFRDERILSTNGLTNGDWFQLWFNVGAAIAADQIERQRYER